MRVLGQGWGGSESGNQTLSDRIFMKEIVGDSLSSFPPPPSSPKELPSFFCLRKCRRLPTSTHLLPEPLGLLSDSVLVSVTWAHAFNFLSRQSSSNLLPMPGSQPEPSAPDPGRCPDPVLHAPTSFQPGGCPGTRGPPRPPSTGCQGTQPLGRKAEGCPPQRGGAGRPGEAPGSWVTRQTSKPRRIL